MRKFLSDRRGVTALEYSLLAGTIALALVSVLEVPAHDVALVIRRVLAALVHHSNNN